MNSLFAVRPCEFDGVKIPIENVCENLSNPLNISQQGNTDN